MPGLLVYYVTCMMVISGGVALYIGAYLKLDNQ